jgi:hypothetical protein
LSAPVASAFRIEQVELQLQRDDRRQPQIAEALQHIDEHMARVAVEGRPIVVVHRHLDLRDAFFAAPGHRHQRASDGQAAAIRVAFVKAEAGLLNGAAKDVECEHRTGQQKAAAIDLRQFVDRHALAARDSTQIGEQYVDEARLWVSLAESGQLRGGVSDRHEGQPV